MIVLGVGGKWDLDKDMGFWDFFIEWDFVLFIVCNEGSNCVL